MENVLPVEIIKDILSRLPVECILQWKQVCKTWRNLPLLDDSHFARSQLDRQPKLLLHDHDNSSKEGGPDDHRFKQYFCHKVSSNCETRHIKVSFLFLADQYSCIRKQIREVPYYGEYDCYDGKLQIKGFGLKPQKLPVDPSFTLVGSCNGLICFSVSDDSTLVCGDPIYICNPVTKEEMYLPRYVDNECVINKLNHVTVTSGFGYIPSTSEYKVVRICAHPNEPFFTNRSRVGYVQVYTLGVDSDWRYKEQLCDHYLARPESDRYISTGVLVDGSLHWLNYYDWKILAFDLAEEVFYEVPSPPCFKNQHAGYDSDFFQLQVLQGNLCIYAQLTNVVVVWWYRKTTTEKNGSSAYTVSGKHDNKKNWRPNRTWVKEFSLGAPPGSGWAENLPIAFTKSGEILFWFDRTILALFDQKTRNVKKLVDGNFGGRVLQVIPHVNSFVSLKALLKRLENYET